MIVIVDYGMGNVGSIVNMLKKVGVAATISGDPEIIVQAKKLVLLGVGAFDQAMKNLRDRGLIPLLHTQVIERKTPIIGLCLGMQLFARGSEEGQLPGLGWIDAEVLRFRFDGENARLKVPHMGWNRLHPCQPHPLLAGLEGENRFYFVHSFYMRCAESRTELAQTRYGFDFTSAVVQGNVLGVQFHPEKSHKFGMRLLRNFAGWVAA